MLSFNIFIGRIISSIIFGVAVFGVAVFGIAVFGVAESLGFNYFRRQSLRFQNGDRVSDSKTARDSPTPN